MAFEFLRRPVMAKSFAKVGVWTWRGWQRRSWWQRSALCAWVLPLICFVMVVARVKQVPAPGVVPPDVGTQRFGVDLETRHAIYGQIVDADPQFRENAKRFPDAWSQADDYHNQLGSWIQSLARHYGLHPSLVFLIYDEGLHEGWVGSRGEKLPGTWPPLVPRIN